MCDYDYMYVLVCIDKVSFILPKLIEKIQKQSRKYANVKNVGVKNG